jgi:hypothetical protein
MIDTILICYTKVSITGIQLWLVPFERQTLKVLHALKMLNVSSIRDPTNVQCVIQLIPFAF